MRTLNHALTLCIFALTAPQAMACFTVYNPASQPVYSGMEPPIDMRFQIHERLPAAFPGGHMVFGSSTDCPAIDARKVSPLLTSVSMASAAANAPPARARSARMRTLSAEQQRNRQADAQQK